MNTGSSPKMMPSVAISFASRGKETASGNTGDVCAQAIMQMTYGEEECPHPTPGEMVT